MKRVILIAFMISLLWSVSAINLEIEGQEKIGIMIKDLQEPTITKLKITNLGSTDSFTFYNLLGFEMEPIEPVTISGKQTKEIELKLYPRDLNYKGFYTFEYYIKAQDGSETVEKLTLKIIDLKDAFEIGSYKINPESKEAIVYIYNKENFNFENIDAEFKSAFFRFSESFSLGPNEKKEFDIKLNKDDFEKLKAGFYTLNAEISVKGLQISTEGKIEFVEGNILVETEKKYGFIITTKAIDKKNEGNTVSTSQTKVRKNIISRLFTSFSPEPDIVEREGFFVYYTWNSQINPGETLNIRVRTNWLFPLLIIFLITGIIFLSKQYSKTDLILRKKVNFVRAKGGEFALKVSVSVHAKKYLERITITDRLPPLTRIYERFGGQEPSRINEKTRRIEWELEKLEAGEMKIFSYIIYSKIGVLGKFALPTAIAIYQRDGEIHEAESNKAFFIAEQSQNQTED